MLKVLAIQNGCAKGFGVVLTQAIEVLPILEHTYKVSTLGHDRFTLYQEGRHNKGKRQNSLPLTTTFSQNVTEPPKGISYPVGDLC